MKKISFGKAWAVVAYPVLWVALLLGLAHSANAASCFQQELQIRGVVSDSQGTMPGVTIKIKGRAVSSVSDADGSYGLSARASDTLVFSSVGYRTQVVPVLGRMQIDIVMQEDATALQEVTVNAGYYTVKDRERTGSIASIKAEDIARQPVTNPLAAMQGRMAGVNIVQSSGVPGGGFDIQIRGRNSIRLEGNAPLYLVDGVPYNADVAGSSLLSGAILPGGGLSPLNSINPADIESIEVLKDADATAIYGSRGANGVVLITTKKGRGGRTSFSINTYTGAGAVTRTMDLLNTQQYLEVRKEAFANDGITTYPSFAHDVNGNWDQERYTDWQKELIGGTALTNSIQASVTGGGKNTTFLLGGSYYKETTVFPGDFAYRKAALNMNLNHGSQDGRFDVSVSANYVADKNNLLATDLTRLATRLAPNAPALYDDQGELNWENSTWENPLRLLRETYLAQNNNLVASSMLRYRPVSGLEFKLGLGYTDSRLDESKVSPSTVFDPAYNLGSEVSFMMQNDAKQQSWSIEPQLGWERPLGDGVLDVLVGATFQERTREQVGLYASGFSSNALITNLMAANQVIVLGNDKSEYRYGALFGRVNYAFRERYFLNLTGRRDGSSRFGPGKRFANFGAIGAAWLFGSEQWVSSALPSLSFGKLRASYGTTGSDQVGDYQFLDTYRSTGIRYQGVVGLEPVRLYNPDFSWETNTKLEMAMELGFFRDRLLLNLAHYRNRSSSQLVGIPLPGTTGFTSITANLDATVQNTGWEVEAKIVPIRTANGSWTLGANITVPRNELLEFPNLEGSTYANQYIIGQPLGIRQVYHYTGVDPETGIYQFEDYDGDGSISAAADRKKTVITAPEYFGGITNRITYKNWELDCLFQFVKQLGSNYAASGTLPGSIGNLPVEVLDRWREPGDQSAVQAYTTGANGTLMTAFSRYASSDAAFSDASFVRLKNLSVSYTLPESWISGTTCRLYLQAQNLLTFTNYRGPDPENQSGGMLPPLRTVAVGVNLNF